MGETEKSPRRRHILSSINPEKPKSRRRSRSPESRSPVDVKREPSLDAPSEHADAQRNDKDDGGDTTAPRRSRIRLKDHRRSRRRSRDRHRHRDYDHDDRHGRSPVRHRRHLHRHRRPHRSPTPNNPHEPEPLDPDAAFRESLFDAMADDEGAAYWESVYGQPVHVYPNERVGPTGHLEQMTDEEYASYVRQKMWEKTNAGLLEERARREEAKKRKANEDRRAQKLQEDMEYSIRRGEERRERRRWEQRWEDYTKAWANWDGTPTEIAWPVEGGRIEDVDEPTVRKFLVNGLNPQEIGEKSFVAKLRDERVRWHPDKIQQKLGGQVDEQTMKGVTAVFQIIDKLWTESRPKT
ncbi:hypothetical protein FPRO06_09439 [Fusarium proliferatum]|nr:hypothetical protein FPRO06_09439 [Fusarium proliferatum]KAI1051385.1 hypothetical protein LB506_003355 [Fusarium annulatum]CVK93980.1 uncharacterized protein FPRN_10409 [Fusarium proliferatum]